MIETTITKIQYDADGVQRRWSIPFPYADVKHISIYTKVGEEPTVKVVDNYDIDEDDSVVIYPTVASGQEPLTSGTKITIARETPETQLEDASQVHFTSKDVERGLDKLTMITQELSTTADETMEVSAAAFETAEEAVDSAALANKTAEEAKTIAGQAVGIATDAKSIAEGIDAKATQALANSNTAVNTANSAKQTVEGIDGKATQALANSTTALETATQAKNTADSYQGQITTLRNDVDDLGDQVAVIEGKIPAEATTANPLADKEFVTTITDELAADITALNADIQQINLIKWVQALPATGETKYLYAIPRNEVDKDGKKIVALYLWDGTEWRGAGGTSIDPGISEGDGIKGDYCTTYGIIDAPNGILTNPSGMEVVLKQGVVLQLAGQDIKTTISGDMAHTITSTADCDLFYVSGTTSLMEVAQIVWSRVEPDNGQAGVLAWWNPDVKKWKFKSNAAGNVWAEAVATPVAHIHTNGTTITRIDHIGFRVLDDEVYALKSDLSLSKRPLGEVFFSQSSLATDNPGALPGWTGEYYENGKTLFPDLYNFVKAHSELQVTKAQYDDAIATYGECPKYVVDENSGTTKETVSAYKITWSPSSKNRDIILSQTPQVGDLLYRFTEPIIDPYPLYAAETHQIEAVGYTDAGVLNSLTISGAAKTVSSLTSVTGTIHIAVAGTSLRLPKYSRSHGTVIKEKKPTDTDPTWYRQWSDGWLEQGGIVTGNGVYGLTTVTLLKPYSSVNYIVKANILWDEGWYTVAVTAGLQGVTDAASIPTNYTTTSFGLQSYSTHKWEAKGQGANGSQENTLYPWISAYTSAIPMSMAQAAEFTGSLSGKANTDLSNVLANIDYVVDSKVPTASDPTWYRKYKSGWVKQGGSLSYAEVVQALELITLLKPMQDLNYNITIMPLSKYRSDTSAYAIMTSVGNKTTTSFLANCYGVSAVDKSVGFTWKAEGQEA